MQPLATKPFLKSDEPLAMSVPSGEEPSELNMTTGIKPSELRIPDFGCCRYNTHELKRRTTFVWHNAAIIDLLAVRQTSATISKIWIDDMCDIPFQKFWGVAAMDAINPALTKNPHNKFCFDSRVEMGKCFAAMKSKFLNDFGKE